MTQKPFAGPHTKAKLDRLAEYLEAFLKVFKNKAWAHTIYIDAFAGTGTAPMAVKSEPFLPLGDEAMEFIVGSARRALELELSFSEFVFIEKGRKNARELEQLRAMYPEKASRIRVENADANEALQAICARTNWTKARGVVFLDPFGNQPEWKTIEAIARTAAVDLWYLFPAGLGVHRQISGKATYDWDKERSLTRLFGTDDWKREFISERERSADLFGETEPTAIKAVTPASATKFMIERMRTVFRGGVLDEWLELGRRGHHSYSLLFACANPSPKANALALKLARAVMRSGKRGRAKRY
jgi:three-Cys-motif partner protein